MVMRILTIYGMLLLFGCANVPEPDGHPDAPVSQSASEQELKRYPDVAVTRLTRIIDGDTFVCDIDELSPIAGKNIPIRLRGINTPELKAKDLEERKAAQVEKQRLSDLLHHARLIELKNLGRDKYFRINADVYIDGEPILPQLNQAYVMHSGVDK